MKIRIRRDISFIKQFERYVIGVDFKNDTSCYSVNQQEGLNWEIKATKKGCKLRERSQYLTCPPICRMYVVILRYMLLA